MSLRLDLHTLPRMGVFGAWRAAFIVARAFSRNVALAWLAVPTHFLALTASGWHGLGPPAGDGEYKP